VNVMCFRGAKCGCRWSAVAVALWELSEAGFQETIMAVLGKETRLSARHTYSSPLLFSTVIYGAPVIWIRNFSLRIRNLASVIQNTGSGFRSPFRRYCLHLYSAVSVVNPNRLCSDPAPDPDPASRVHSDPALAPEPDTIRILSVLDPA